MKLPSTFNYRLSESDKGMKCNLQKAAHLTTVQTACK